MKKKIINVITIMFILCASFFTGCSCNFSFDKMGIGALSTPQIVSHLDYDTITWKTIKNATSYNVYCDGKIIDTIVDKYKEDLLLYEIGKYVNDDKEHSIYITASSDNFFIKESEKSNEIKYKNNNVVTLQSYLKYNYDIRKNINFKLEGSEISYTPVEGIDEYYLFMYSNSSKTQVKKLDGQAISLKSSELELDKKNDITYLRLGYCLDGEYYLISNELYYNPDSYAGYTDNIVLFDGYIYDHYIESLQELNTVVYSNFINRNEVYDIKLSDEMLNFVISAFSGGNMAEKIDNAVFYVFTNIMETSEVGVYPGKNGFATILDGHGEYKIKIDYNGNNSDYGSGECDVNLSPMVEREEDACGGYYDSVDYTMRKEQFGTTGGEFASDKHLLQIYVESSEELYWAVENKITPKFYDNTSRAYNIYTQAKMVINSVISEEMTDYEKALSLFDWICINTVYDFSDYDELRIHVSNQPCYYLEGVFNTGYAVCDGYSKAYSLMCNMIGIECIRITGEAVSGGESGGHAWNKIVLDVDPENNNGKECYLVDITWTEIQTSESSEILSRMYFMLSDEDVKDTHFPFNYRTEFTLYECPERFGYYQKTKFGYKSTTHDLVISSDAELKDYFGYIRDNSVRFTEIIVDYDYMVDVYKLKTNKQYNPNTDYRVNKDKNGTAYGITYFYELHNIFKSKLSECKKSEFFDLQFLSYVRSDDVVFYDDDKCGLVFVIEQFLLIDEKTNVNNEVDILLKYLDENNLVGNEYNLYIRKDILNTVNVYGVDDYLSKAVILFNSSIYQCRNIAIQIELLKGLHVYSGSNVGCLFNIKIMSAN